ncbi:MAG: hypothetical protein NC120_09345 [Ruminococcus sp.]|nr:hypothetical protein [Ruminococcus sp.]
MKKIISVILSLVMTANIMAIFPVNVFAATENSRVYEKDGYTVTYKIGNEWDNNRSATVTLENTGEESILNRALKYDAVGEVLFRFTVPPYCARKG